MRWNGEDVAVVVPLASGVASVRDMSWSASASASNSGSAPRRMGAGSGEGGLDCQACLTGLDFVFDFEVGVGVVGTFPRFASRCFRFLLEALGSESSCFLFLVLCDGFCPASREAGDFSRSIDNERLECKAQLFYLLKKAGNFWRIDNNPPSKLLMNLPGAHPVPLTYGVLGEYSACLYSICKHSAFLLAHRDDHLS